jgi:hypothetical protein
MGRHHPRALGRSQPEAPQAKLEGVAGGGIENRQHYVRDVTCDEDRSRIRHNPGIMARARSFALNIVRHNGVTNVAQALWNGALSLDTVLAYKAI